MAKRNRNTGVVNNEQTQESGTDVAQETVQEVLQEPVVETPAQTIPEGNKTMTASKIKSVETTVYTTEDGQQFTNLALAEAHQSFLENKETIEVQVSSYLNKMEMVGRQRKIHETIASAFAAFLVGFDGVQIARTVEEPIAEAPEAEQAADAEQAAEAEAEANEMEDFDA